MLPEQKRKNHTEEFIANVIREFHGIILQRLYAKEQAEYRRARPIAPRSVSQKAKSTVTIQEYEQEPCSNGPIIGDNNRPSVTCGPVPLSLSKVSQDFVRDKFKLYSGHSITFRFVGTVGQNTRKFVNDLSAELQDTGVISTVGEPLAWFGPPVICPTSSVLFMLPPERIAEYELLETVFIKSGLTKDEISKCVLPNLEFKVYLFNK